MMTDKRRHSANWLLLFSATTSVKETLNSNLKSETLLCRFLAKELEQEERPQSVSAAFTSALCEGRVSGFIKIRPHRNLESGQSTLH